MIPTRPRDLGDATLAMGTLAVVCSFLYVGEVPAVIAAVAAGFFYFLAKIVVEGP
jgi:hypothetical protein